MITTNKIRIIHVAKRQTGMDDEYYHALLKTAAGVETCKDLDDPGFERVMAAFKLAGFQSVAAKTNLGDRPGMATPRQISMIKSLWKRYTKSEDPRRLGRWLETHFHVSDLRFLQDWRAGKAIAILQKMNLQRPKQKRAQVKS